MSKKLVSSKYDTEKVVFFYTSLEEIIVFERVIKVVVRNTNVYVHWMRNLVEKVEKIEDVIKYWVDERKYIVDGKVKDRYSDIFWYCGRVYRYDYKDAYLQWLENSDDEPEKYEVVDEIGLSRDNWDDLEARKEYIDGWVDKQNAEVEAMMPWLAAEFGF